MRERTFFCKALGVTPRTLEIFDSLGFVQDAIDAGIWLRGLSSFNDGEPGAMMELPTDLPFGSLSLAQFETERLLENCLHKHGGTVSYGWTLSGFDARADGVRVQIESPDGVSHPIDCRWLVGCDGAHSRVRSVLGLDSKGGGTRKPLFLQILKSIGICRGAAFIASIMGQLPSVAVRRWSPFRCMIADIGIGFPPLYLNPVRT